VNDFLDDRRREISERLKELKPFVDEFNRLEEAASALAGVVGSAASEAGGVITGRRKPGRPRGTGRRKKATTRTRTAASATATRSTGTRRKAKRAAAKPKAAAARKPGRPPAKRRAGRRKGSGTRAAEALSFVQGQPGITIPELAAKMGIKQNYLYRVLPGLESEKKVQKKDRGWYPKG
jgi:hypothetical protein